MGGVTETLHILSIGKPVSRIVLGTWAIGRAMRDGSDDAEFIATTHHAVERSINLIDTALVYGGRVRWKGCARLVMDGQSGVHENHLSGNEAVDRSLECLADQRPRAPADSAASSRHTFPTLPRSPSD